MQLFLAMIMCGLASNIGKMYLQIGGAKNLAVFEIYL